MRLIILTTLTLALSSTSYSQNRPSAEYKSGKIKIIVWENEKDGKYGPYTDRSYKIEKFYFDDGDYKVTDYYSYEELLELKAIIDKAVNEEEIEVEEISDN